LPRLPFSSQPGGISKQQSLIKINRCPIHHSLGSGGSAPVFFDLFQHYFLPPSPWSTQRQLTPPTTGSLPCDGSLKFFSMLSSSHRKPLLKLDCRFFLKIRGRSGRSADHFFNLGPSLSPYPFPFRWLQGDPSLFPICRNDPLIGLLPANALSPKRSRFPSPVFFSSRTTPFKACTMWLFLCHWSLGCKRSQAL